MSEDRDDQAKWHKKKLTRFEEVTYSHRRLWLAASRLADQADESPLHNWYSYLASQLLSFFAMEGLLNHIGEELCGDVWKDERRFFAGPEYQGTLGKFDHLAEELGLELDKSCRPYQSLKSLAKLRNDMVHPRTEISEGTREMSVADMGKASPLIQASSQDNTSQIRGDLETLGNQLFAAAEAHGLKVVGGSGAFSGTTESHYYPAAPGVGERCRLR